MEDLWNQVRFTIEVAWYRMKYELTGQIVLGVVLVAVILLLWIFLSPSVRSKR